MTLAKGLGGGFPIGAVIAFGAATHDLLRPGQHGTTFGGNPLAAAVGLAVIGTMIDEELLQHTRRVGDQLAQAITALDRKSTRLNSSHVAISYAVFCLEKKNISGNF